MSPRSALRRRLLTALTGDPDGRTPWITEVAEGEDEGYFGPESPTWVVHGDMPTLVAGIRALLMQTLHPGAMAGVHDWSRYRTDAAGRLAGTIRWIVAVTFGSRAQADRESARVGRFHDRVSGTYGDGIAYSAHDPELLDWVHLAFTEAFLGCQETWGRPIPQGADAYVADWATAGRLVGAQNPPASRAGLHAELERLRVTGVLRRDERVDDAVRFLRTPPIAGSGLAYRILFAGAVASIPPEFRRLLGLRRAWWPAITLTRAVLAVAGAVLAGSPSPSARELAIARVARLRATVER
ncbi:MAG TPA: oxygenase MpaB family protein [Pseudolysinimonas sp.]|nr:oxygenase MpaB family protein [Pseudolysinimonas sp.]